MIACSGFSPRASEFLVSMLRESLFLSVLKLANFSSPGRGQIIACVRSQALLGRCENSSRFAGLTDAIFALHLDWVAIDCVDRVAWSAAVSSAVNSHTRQTHSFIDHKGLGFFLDLSKRVRIAPKDKTNATMSMKTDGLGSISSLLFQGTEPD
jgi:hypothetical protein